MVHVYSNISAVQVSNLCMKFLPTVLTEFWEATQFFGNLNVEYTKNDSSLINDLVNYPRLSLSKGIYASYQNIKQARASHIDIFFPPFTLADGFSSTMPHFPG
jgi:hypothetical protein